MIHVLHLTPFHRRGSAPQLIQYGNRWLYLRSTPPKHFRHSEPERPARGVWISPGIRSLACLRPQAIAKFVPSLSRSRNETFRQSIFGRPKARSITGQNHRGLSDCDPKNDFTVHRLQNSFLALLERTRAITSPAKKTCCTQKFSRVQGKKPGN